MKEKRINVDVFLYNLLFEMCADVGCMDEAVEIFKDMKSSWTCQPDNFTYSCLINMYSSHLKLTESLESSNPWEQQVSTILKGIGDMVVTAATMKIMSIDDGGNVGDNYDNDCNGAHGGGNNNHDDN